MKAMFNAVLDQPVPEAAQALVGSLVADIKEKSENNEQLPVSEDINKGDPIEVMEKQLQFVKKVVDLLNTKANPDEAAGFKEWLYGVAKAVSEAAKEGSHLGFGGVRVSKKEKYALETLQFILRM